MENTFLVDGIAYDNRDGMGAVPDVQNIDYMGFVAWMRPSTFLDLCPPLDARVAGVEVRMREGRAIGMPYLEVDLTEEVPTIHGHEGRHRMRAAILIRGDEELPIAFLLKGGDRARHVDMERLRLMADGMLSEAAPGGEQRFVPGPLFTKVRLLGEMLDLNDVPSPRF